MRAWLIHTVLFQSLIYNFFLHFASRWGAIHNDKQNLAYFYIREFVKQYTTPFLIIKGSSESMIIKLWDKIICIIKHEWPTFQNYASSRFLKFEEMLNMLNKY